MTNSRTENSNTNPQYLPLKSEPTQKPAEKDWPKALISEKCLVPLNKGCQRQKSRWQSFEQRKEKKFSNRILRAITRTQRLNRIC